MPTLPDLVEASVLAGLLDLLQGINFLFQKLPLKGEIFCGGVDSRIAPPCD